VTRRNFSALALAAAPPPPRPETPQWRTPTQTTGIDVSWRVSQGVYASIANARRQCDLWTVREYADFHFTFEWKVAPGANTGIKYLIQASAVDQLKDAQGEFLHETSLGYEFQLIDDASPAGQADLHASGALYNYLPPVERAARPAGEWNTGALVVKAKSVEHWINQRRVLAFELGSPELRVALAKKKLNSARLMERLAKRRSPIVLQHHESSVWFRALQVRAFADPSETVGV